MRKHFLFFLSFFFIACLSKKYDFNNNEKIADYSENNIIFAIDTLRFKKHIANEIFFNENKSFDKMEICYEKSIGDTIIDYYFLKLTDFKRNISTIRYLEKRDNSFFFDNNSSEKALFVTCICNSNKNYFPKLAIIKKGRFWICGNSIGQCSPDSECQIMKAIILE